MAERIRLSRAKGWRLPPRAQSVARPSRWGNPYRVGADYEWKTGEPCPYPRAWTPGLPTFLDRRIIRCDSRATAVTWYRAWITEMVPIVARDAATCLAGWDLACWCPLDGEPCHADVLLDLAAAGVPSECAEADR